MPSEMLHGSRWRGLPRLGFRKLGVGIGLPAILNRRRRRDFHDLDKRSGNGGEVGVASIIVTRTLIATMISVLLLLLLLLPRVILIGGQVLLQIVTLLSRWTIELLWALLLTKTGIAISLATNGREAVGTLRVVALILRLSRMN